MQSRGPELAVARDEELKPTARMPLTRPNEPVAVSVSVPQAPVPPVQGPELALAPAGTPARRDAALLRIGPEPPAVEPPPKAAPAPLHIAQLPRTQAQAPKRIPRHGSLITVYSATSQATNTDIAQADANVKELVKKIKANSEPVIARWSL